MVKMIAKVAYMASYTVEYSDEFLAAFPNVHPANGEKVIGSTDNNVLVNCSTPQTFLLSANQMPYLFKVKVYQVT
jgi:hypothetical protein